METVRDILAAHSSGISRPGLLAWARLRIDTAMTEAQLEEELARLGDEVVDVDGFLYLRANLQASRRPGGAARGAAGGAPVPSDATAAGPATWTSRAGEPAQRRRSGLWAVIGIGFFLFMAARVLGLVGDLAGGLGDLVGDATSLPAASAPAGATEPPGTPVEWTALVAGDCFNYSDWDGGAVR